MASSQRGFEQCLEQTCRSSCSQNATCAKGSHAELAKLDSLQACEQLALVNVLVPAAGKHVWKSLVVLCHKDLIWSTAVPCRVRVAGYVQTAADDALMAKAWSKHFPVLKAVGFESNGAPEWVWPAPRHHGHYGILRTLDIACIECFQLHGDFVSSPSWRALMLCAIVFGHSKNLLMGIVDDDPHFIAVVLKWLGFAQRSDPIDKELRGQVPLYVQLSELSKKALKQLEAELAAKERHQKFALIASPKGAIGILSYQTQPVLA